MTCGFESDRPGHLHYGSSYAEFILELASLSSHLDAPRPLIQSVINIVIVRGEERSSEKVLLKYVLLSSQAADRESPVAGDDDYSLQGGLAQAEHSFRCFQGDSAGEM